jgi:3-oxoacyl-[acyl-carrier protein] reductase/pteridine reductase
MPPSHYSDSQNTAIAARTLLDRWGSAEDVASAVRYLIEADYVTGETLFVDGGEHLAQYKRRS